jgi:hypothetical protein
MHQLATILLYYGDFGSMQAMLVADEDAQPFYRRLGFAPYPDVMARLDWDRLYDVSPAALHGKKEAR